jgi:hypothetical protein
MQNVGANWHNDGWTMIFGIGMASSFAPALLDRSRPDHSQAERSLLIDMTRAGVWALADLILWSKRQAVRIPILRLQSWGLRAAVKPKGW